MYLKRKIDQYLDEWKRNDDRKPLIVKGPRQVGKTKSIREFARKNYPSIIEINFVENPIYKAITKDGHSVASVIKAISLINNNFSFVPHKTLIFFDEIQKFPDIATSLKFFKIDGRFDVICSGSLLGINYQEIESNSVGYKEDYEMSSLDFEEFLWAKGYKDDTIADMLMHMLQKKAFSDLDMTIYTNLFFDYCILGGMPSIILSYLKNGTFSNILTEQKQLVLDHEEDIRKYVTGLDQTRILNVYRHIAPQLAKDNKKFQISKVSHGATLSKYIGCIDWLTNSGVIKACYNLIVPESPLKGNYDSEKFKLYYFDTGMLIAQLDEESQIDMRRDNDLGIYKGAVYENIAAEALYKQGYDLYYYRREDSMLEEDFFVRDRALVVPIEIKASDGKTKSLSTLISSDKYHDIKYGIKFCTNNVGESNKIYTFPLFCLFLLKRFLLQNVNSYQ